MTANAQDQVSRMLALVPYLRAREGISVTEVAEVFGVAPAQIVKDLKVVWFCGLPNAVSGDQIEIDIEALEGEGIVRLTNADYLTRPMRLAPAEALALIVALRTLREASSDAEREVVDRALGKLETATGDAAEAAGNVEVHIDPVDPEIRARVEEGIRQRKRLRLSYYVPARDETTERDFDPMRLVAAEGHTYVEGWCYRAEESRLFRLDRVASIDVLDVPADPPAEAQPRDLSRGLFQPDEDDPIAVLDLAPSASWVADYYPVEDQRSLPAGHQEIRIRYSDESWLVRLVSQLGGAATITSPVELSDKVRNRAAEALSLYNVG